MSSVIQRDGSGGQRTTSFFAPPSTSLSTVVGFSGTNSPTRRLEFDKLDTSPFSECFSSWFDDEEADLYSTRYPPSPYAFPPTPKTRVVDPDLSYDVKVCFTNVRDWDNQIDEIMVLSPKHKTRLPSITDQSRVPHDRKITICVSDFASLHPLKSNPEAEMTLCRKRDTNRLYVLRSVRLVLDSEQPRSKHSLLKMVHRLRSPFLSILHWSFEDQGRMHFVMDFYPGGNLLTHLKRSGTFHPDRAHFYACEILEGLTTLHEASIVHCDLKPENVMMDADGHIVLTGFERAKVLGSGSNIHIQRTAIPCSTKEYQAPEIHLGWVHDFSVDCWAFGILLYVMLFGRHPFVDHGEFKNQDILRNNIVRGSTPYQPLQPIGIVARDLIAKCLERNPIVRFNIGDIKTHSYFTGVNWTSVASKRVTVPWVPELDRNRVDLRYSDVPSKAMRETSAAQPLNEPQARALDSLKTLRTQDDNDANITTRLPRSDADEHIIGTSRPTAHVQEALGIFQPPPTQIIPRGSGTRSTYLAAVAEADEDELDEPRKAIGGIDFKDRLEEQLREQVAKNRASFWDTLSDDQSLSSRHSLDFKDALGLSAPQSHKLRKPQSSALVDRIASTISISTIVRKEQIMNKLRKRVQIVSSPVMILPQDSPALNLPTGIIQTGHGIGFTYSLGPATLSKASLCTTTPRTCHGLSLKGFPKLVRKMKRRVGSELASPASLETDDDWETEAIMKEIYGSTWSLGMSAVNLSQPLAYATASSPLSSTLSPCSQLPDTPEFADADEAIAGDPDTTLRLVSPPSSLPHCD
ncbi:hypothetical protein PILCRDRAFT_821098 [Piloderma croceum F 1598]|uniref:Protein kinase domain-containing protein n=1 Tax=Piloderma croceum (strain F 1598) TaxID=765440 RepID=A0A0C3B687_PILCF|nr:hypothetical protein PILCRDRAFT_821098 [Piloderma croceum F 1598]